MSENVRKKDNIVRKIGYSFNLSAEKWIPDSLIFAILLSIIMYIAGIVITGQGPIEMLEHWYSGFWGFLEFTTQMALIVTTGNALANTSLVSGWLDKLAKIGNTPKKAVSVTFVAAFIGSYFNWGFGLVVGALIAVKISEVNTEIDYPLNVAAAYSGAMLGTMGLSASAPLLVNTPGHFLEESLGLISLTDTVFAPRTLLIQLALLIIIVITFRLMIPANNEDLVKVEIDTDGEDSGVSEVNEEPEPSFASYLENATWISMTVGLAGLIVVIRHFMENGFDLNINILNFIFLILGIILHRKPINYVRAFGNAIPSIAGIMLQFPFYGGIMGMMSGSGLVSVFSAWTLNFATQNNFPVIAYLQSAVVNFFVPSAGGKFLIQGPVLLEAAEALNASNPLTLIAYSFGDLTTNLIQPFWALPLLGIANLKIKDIWGYCLVATIVALVVTSIGLFI